MTPIRLISWALGLVAFSLVGCQGGGDKAPPSGDQSGAAAPAPAKPGPVSLNGAGATFPYPLYSKWMSEYNTLHPDIMINYQSIGSGGGIRQITAKTVDFGATDAPMNADEEAKAPAKLLHIPTTIGAVAVVFNLPGVTELQLAPDALVGIYQGTITKWNDKKIAETNPGAKLPATPIVVAYRSDGSGTTAVFTDYLAKVSPDWKDKVGVGKSIKWPVGLGAKGNEGVTEQVKRTPGGIGYVELAYAITNSLATAALKNASGKFVKPDIAAVTAAASGVEMPDTLTVSITNATGDAVYPISSFTYLLVYQDAPDATKGKALANFVWWAIHDGQKLSEPLHYAPLPAAVVAKVEAKLKTLSSGGKPLLSET
ncbi:MAG TPA: phosphate ABC transporter substrate-binding protein PstS [Polyangiaceae bacterium]|jgi:phosphate transport system substrate-binding protein|nr:phosphate ABC transporter substrate-binding protein PstS [Polyangiaceae bacterium]